MIARALPSALVLLCATSSVRAEPLRIARVRPAPLVLSSSPRNAEGAPTPPKFCVDSNNKPVTCKLEYFGGPVISNVKPYAVFWGPNVDPTTTSNVPGFLAAVTNSDYMDWLNEYRTDINVQAGPDLGMPGTQQFIGRGVFGGAFTITPSTANACPSTATPPSPLYSDQIAAEIDAQIAAGHLPHSDANTIYMLYFAPGCHINSGTSAQHGDDSCQQFCAYHGTVQRTSDNSIFYYAVMPDFGSGSGCDTGCGNGATFDNLCSASSHELIEAVTDAQVGLATTNAPPLAWYDNNAGEVGDMCNQNQDTITSLDGTTTYTVQQIFSQTDYKSDPNTGCVTTRSEPNDFSVWMDPNIASIPKGSIGAAIPISSAAINSPGQIKLTISGLPTGVTSSLDVSTINAGDTANLTIDATSAAATSIDAVVVVKAEDLTSHVVHTAGLLLQVPAGTTGNDFSLSVPTATTALLPSGSKTITVSTARTSGTAQAITLSVTGLPAGVNGVFNPTAPTAGQSSALTLTSTSAAPQTAAAITITGVTTSQPSGHSVTNAKVQVDGLPTAQITNPSAGTISGTVGVNATATKGTNATLATLVIKIDGATKATGTSSPQTYSWDTTGASNGAHVITAVATDTDGGSTTATTNVIVNNVAGGNDFSIALSPAKALATIGLTPAVYTVSTTATGTAETVSLTVTGLPPGVQATFNPQSLQAGGTSTLTLTAPAGTAPAGNTSFSLKGTSLSVPGGHTASAIVTVIAPPTATVTAPLGGTVSGTVLVTATATVDASAPIVSLVLHDGAATIGTSSTASASASWNTTQVANGVHLLTAVVTDSAGNAVSSPAVSVTVSNSVTTTGDFALSLTPSSVAVTVGSSTNITVSTTIATGAPGPIALDAGVLPTGVTASFAPNPVTAGQTSLLTLTAASSASPGSGTLTVTGTASGIARTTTAPLTLAGSGAISVSLTAPADGAQVSGTVQLVAAATLKAGVTLARIDFFADDAKIGTTTSSPGGMTWSLQGVATGNHVLLARAFASTGESAASQAVSVTVAQASGGGGGGGCSTAGGGWELPSLAALAGLFARRRKAARRK